MNAKTELYLLKALIRNLIVIGLLKATSAKNKFYQASHVFLRFLLRVTLENQNREVYEWFTSFIAQVVWHFALITDVVNHVLRDT